MNENEKILCSVCGHEHDAEDIYYVDDEPVCDDCLNNGDFFYCENCDTYHHVDDEVVVNGRESWCTDCAENDATLCDDCGEYFTESRIYTDGHGNAVCHTCFDRHDWHECGDCGRFFCDGDGDWDDFDDEWYCDSCTRDHDDNRPIHDYGYKPTPEFAYRRNERVGCLTGGAEIEVDKRDGSFDERDETAKAVVEASNGRLYCKSDGSLSSYGFEIVSHPASLAYHMYDFRWANVMRICSKAGYKSHDTATCGLHIHVGRAQMGDTAEQRILTAGKLVILASRLRDELTVFSRRKAEQLERWADFVEYTECIHGDGDEAEMARALSAINATHGRYHAVNLTNSSTVEFRIFRGTLKRDTFIASMQLVFNLCEYAMTHTTLECNRVSFADIVNHHPYKELVAYSASKSLISTTIVAA